MPNVEKELQYSGTHSTVQYSTVQYSTVQHRVGHRVGVPPLLHIVTHTVQPAPSSNKAPSSNNAPPRLEYLVVLLDGEILKGERSVDVFGVEFENLVVTDYRAGLAKDGVLGVEYKHHILQSVYSSVKAYILQSMSILT